MFDTNYDLIVIGAGAGGGTLARRIAPSGKKILIIERGPWLAREKRNWEVNQVVLNRCYETKEEWLDKDNNRIRSNAHYNVGGNTKFWGAALFRFRERDFEKVVHPDGISPEWPLKYRDFEPYYTEVEKMYEVRGKRGVDNTEPPFSEEYPYPPISHEPVLEEICGKLRSIGLHPFHLPVAIRMNEDRKFLSECIRCDTCDGFPCLIGAKADAEWNGVRPALKNPNVTLLTETKVLRLLTTPDGREISGVEAELEGRSHTFKGDIVVVSCGAINSAALLLRSANEKHPTGLANSSDQVGRNYMYHLLGAMTAVSKRANTTTFQKTFGLNDFYWGEPGYQFPMGNIQTTGKVTGEMLAAQLEKPVCAGSFDEMAEHATDWWLMTEDVPNSDNRVTWECGTVKISYRENNRASFDRLQSRWMQVLSDIGLCDVMMDMKPFYSFKVPIQGVAHQCGTLRFGTDPKTSVLDVSCKAHDLNNLYVVDSSFYPSSAALNPTHTLLANSLRVADHLMERMK